MFFLLSFNSIDQPNCFDAVIVQRADFQWYEHGIVQHNILSGFEDFNLRLFVLDCPDDVLNWLRVGNTFGIRQQDMIFAAVLYSETATQFSIFGNGKFYLLVVAKFIARRSTVVKNQYCRHQRLVAFPLKFHLRAYQCSDIPRIWLQNLRRQIGILGEI